MRSQIENGIYASTLTPLHSDLSINHEMLTDHSHHLIKKGCKGVFLFGTTGEGASFSLEEKKKAIIQTIALGMDPSKIIIGNGSACLQISWHRRGSQRK